MMRCLEQVAILEPIQQAELVEKVVEGLTDPAHLNWIKNRLKIRQNEIKFGSRRKVSESKRKEKKEKLDAKHKERDGDATKQQVAAFGHQSLPSVCINLEPKK